MLAIAKQYYIQLAMIGLWGFCVSTVVLNGIVSRQQLTPTDLQARVNTTGRMVAYGGTPFGALLGGLVASHAGVLAAIMTTAVMSGVLAILVWFSPLSKKSGCAYE